MRAAVLHQIGDTKLDVRDDVGTVDVGPCLVRVKIHATGVCHSDLSAMRGILPQMAPAVLGHEGAGEVVEIGEGVSDLAIGDHVIICWVPPCGRVRSGQARCVAAGVSAPHSAGITPQGPVAPHDAGPAAAGGG